MRNCCEFKQTLAGRYFPVIFPSPLLKFWAEISISLSPQYLQSRAGFSELLWRPFPRTCWLHKHSWLLLVPKVFSVPAHCSRPTPSCAFSPWSSPPHQHRSKLKASESRRSFDSHKSLLGLCSDVYISCAWQFYASVSSGSTFCVWR